MKVRYAWAYAAGVIVLAGLYIALLGHPVAAEVVYHVIGLSAIAAIGLGVWRNKPEDRRAWIYVGAGVAAIVVGDAVYYYLKARYGEAPFPSLADAFYLGMYPSLLLALRRLIKQVAPGRDWASIVDAAVVSIGLSILFTVFVINRYLLDPTLDWGMRIVSVAYPVMDIALIVMSVRLMTSTRLKRPSYLLLSLGLVSMLIADLLYGVATANATFGMGNATDIFWLGYYGGLGVAALHPDMARPPQRRQKPFGMTKSGIVVMAGVALLVPIANVLPGQNLDKYMVTIASCIIFLLVTVRLFTMVGLIQSQERQARHDSLHDSLTGLANRVRFIHKVDQFAERNRRHNIAVLFIDLDDFKLVNDTLGHDAGDQLLIEVANRLREVVGPDNLVARLSGDEFAALIQKTTDVARAPSLAECIREVLAEPVYIDEQELRVSASIGIRTEPCLTFPGAEVILRQADSAMYQAKAGGKDQYVVYTPESLKAFTEQDELKEDLQFAQDRGELELRYQPIFQLYQEKTEAIAAVEAIPFWRHPTRGVLPPEEFMPLAEQMGMAINLGRWLLVQACTQLGHWQRRHPQAAPGQLTVRLSGHQLRSVTLPGDVQHALAVSGLQPDSLVLALDNVGSATRHDHEARSLQQLKQIGVHIAVEDFISRSPSFWFLRDGLVDMVTIDQCLVREFTANPKTQALISSVITMVDRLGATTSAQGVDQEDALAGLTQLGCNRAQGDLLSGPLPAQRLEAMLTEQGTIVRI